MQQPWMVLTRARRKNNCKSFYLVVLQVASIMVLVLPYWSRSCCHTAYGEPINYIATLLLYVRVRFTLVFVLNVLNRQLAVSDSSFLSIAQPLVLQSPGLVQTAACFALLCSEVHNSISSIKSIWKLFSAKRVMCKVIFEMMLHFQWVGDTIQYQLMQCLGQAKSCMPGVIYNYASHLLAAGLMRVAGRIWHLRIQPIVAL